MAIVIHEYQAREVSFLIVIHCTSRLLCDRAPTFHGLSAAHTFVWRQRRLWRRGAQKGANNVYDSPQDDELSTVKGEKLHIINKFPDEWYLVQNAKVSV